MNGLNIEELEEMFMAPFDCQCEFWLIEIEGELQVSTCTACGMVVISDYI